MRVLEVAYGFSVCDKVSYNDPARVPYSVLVCIISTYQV